MRRHAVIFTSAWSAEKVSYTISPTSPPSSENIVGDQQAQGDIADAAANSLSGVKTRQPAPWAISVWRSRWSAIVMMIATPALSSVPSSEPPWPLRCRARFLRQVGAASVASTNWSVQEEDRVAVVGAVDTRCHLAAANARRIIHMCQVGDHGHLF